MGLSIVLCMFGVKWCPSPTIAFGTLLWRDALQLAHVDVVYLACEFNLNWHSDVRFALSWWTCWLHVSSR